jgi:ubiquinone biosynthesis protein COQ9
MEAQMDDRSVKDQLLDAALLHVPFDGWGPASFDAAVADAGVDPGLAKAVCPRGAVDLALAYHQRGDEEMIRRIHAEDLSTLRFRDRVAAAVRFRIEAAEDKEIVRRGTTLFPLPNHAGDGARAIWGTADKIWTALGDRSDDVNWYTKRTILSGVYSSTVLYWLGDESEGNAATWAFLDRRIDDVMQFEKVKAKLRDNRAFNTVFAGPLALIGKIRAPMRPPDDLPGRWNDG